MKLSQPWLACGVGGLILAGVMTDRALHQVPAADADPYHARVREAAAGIPEDFGDWHSVEVEVPTGAQKLLRSNVLISRDYTNQKTGQKVSFLLVQCGDARDLAGHFPGVCYPNAGYVLAEPARLDDQNILHVQGTNYKFTQETLEGTRAMWVFNIMVLPDGRTSPDMDGVYSIARNRQMRYFGAAEIQVITNVGMPETERTQVIDMLLAGYRPLIDAIRSGVTR